MRQEMISFYGGVSVVLSDDGIRFALLQFSTLVARVCFLS